jgi:DNA-binding HxlR family transcriptional regulator
MQAPRFHSSGAGYRYRCTLLVLLSLKDAGAPMRFSALSKAIPDVSQKMLTATLRELEADGGWSGARHSR